MYWRMRLLREQKHDSPTGWVHDKPRLPIAPLATSNTNVPESCSLRPLQVSQLLLHVRRSTMETTEKWSTPCQWPCSDRHSTRCNACGQRELERGYRRGLETNQSPRLWVRGCNERAPLCQRVPTLASGRRIRAQWRHLYNNMSSERERETYTKRVRVNTQLRSKNTSDPARRPPIIARLTNHSKTTLEWWNKQKKINK